MQRKKTQGGVLHFVCHLAILHEKSIYLKKGKKKKNGNSNISPCKNYNLQKIPFKKIKIKTKILQDIIN
jgi:hypothetical protein